MAERYLLNLCDQECQERWRRKIERLLRESCLPLEKTFATAQPGDFVALLVHLDQEEVRAFLDSA